MPSLDQVHMGDQVPVAPPLIMNGEKRLAFLNLAQDMTSQANGNTSQIKAMMTQVNLEVGPRMPHHASIMASHLTNLLG